MAEDLLVRTTERLARKYGEVLHVSDIAHLLGKSEFRVRRWLNDSKSGRALRARGTKPGRCVCWPVFVVAEFFVYGESEHTPSTGTVTPNLAVTVCRTPASGSEKKT